MPEKELFNQELKQTISLTDRFATGVPTQLGADNILFSDFLRFTGCTLCQRFLGVSTDQTLTLTVGCKILDIDYNSSGTAEIEATETDAGDVIPLTEFSGKLNNYINRAYVSPITLSVNSGTVDITVRYINNYY